MKKILLWAVFLTFFCILSGKELAVNGNFQPDVRSKYAVPRFWHSQHTGYKNELHKVKFLLSEPDAQGIHTLQVKTSADFKKTAKNNWKNFCLYTTNIKELETIKGDTFHFSVEIAGKGRLSYGFLGYGTKGIRKNIQPTEKFQKYTFIHTTGAVKGDASGKSYYRLFFEFTPGSSLSIRNVKLTKKPASGKDVLRANFRYYPVYKLPEPPSDTLEKDLPNWKNIPEGKGFLINKIDKFQRIARQSSFKMAHWKNKLYILVHCKEPYMDLVEADQFFWRDGVSVKDDIIEFAISSKRGLNLVHSYNRLNSKGASKRNHSFKKIPNIVKAGKDHWMIRFCFDFDDLLLNKEKLLFNKDYYFNIGRTNHTNNNKYIHSSISREFGQTGSFQIMELLNKIPSAKEKNSAEELFNGRYYSFLTGECRKIANRTPAFWEKEYAQYGRINKETLEKAMQITRKAAEAKTLLQKEESICSCQQMDKILRTAQKKITLLLTEPSKVKKLFVNGKSIPISAKIPITIQQGVNIICAETLSNAKVSFMAENYPETWKAWRISNKSAPNWLHKDFDDTKWQMAKCDDKGVFTSSSYARQILIWENTHYGSWSLFTKTKATNFVNKSLNTLKMQLDTPTNFPLKELRLTFELPSAYKTFEYNDARKASNDLLHPFKVTKTPGKRKGYTRYIYDYKGNIRPSSSSVSSGSYLVFQADDSMKPFSTFFFSYSRSSGNIVELTKNMPCKVLPPINGRLLKKILLEAKYRHCVPKALFKNTDLNFLHIKDSLRAGVNMQNTEEYYDSLFKNTPVRIVILTCYPIWGSGWGRKKHFYHFVKNHKEAQARFFGGKVKWGGKAPANFPRYMDRRETTQVCPTWATGKGSKDYIKYVMLDMQDLQKKYPHATIYYNNWEGFPSVNDMGYCYCNACKEHFRKYASIAPDILLTDEIIRDRYWKKWYEFRVKMDGRIAALVKKAANTLNMKYFLYHQYAHPDYWKAAAGNIDIPYQGCPGSAPADSKMQHIMDNVAKYMQRYTYSSFMGQIFNPGWNRLFKMREHSLNSYSSFYEPQTTKTQIIRSVATNRGGLSIWGANLSGEFYYIGEATRLLAAYEDIFAHGTRKDHLVRSNLIAYPDCLVISRKNPAGKEERLILLFNEEEKAKEVHIENLSLPAKYSAELFEGKKDITNAEKMLIFIPPQDVTALCIREK